MFQIRKIDGVSPVLIQKFIFDNITIAIFDAVVEVIVDWRLDDDVFARSGKPLDYGENRRHHARRKRQVFLFHFQAMTFFPPIDVGIVPGVGNIRIPENAMI